MTAKAKAILLSGGNPQIAKADGDAPEGEFDEAQMTTWVRQAAALRGWAQ